VDEKTNAEALLFRRETAARTVVEVSGGSEEKAKEFGLKLR
jgi:hypothetical protein